MAVPTPPTAGEPIAEAWGDVVHDAVVANDIQIGTGTATFANANQANTTITFPRPFAVGAVPAIMIMVGPHNAGGFVLMSAQIGGTVNNTTAAIRLVSTTGTNSTGTNVPFTWLAYGPRA